MIISLPYSSMAGPSIGITSSGTPSNIGCLRDSPSRLSSGWAVRQKNSTWRHDRGALPGRESARDFTFASQFASIGHLRSLTRVEFCTGRPISLEWGFILYVWTNYNIRERYLRDGLCRNGRFERTKEILDKAMNSCKPEGKRTELRWWWSFDDNDISVTGDY